MSTSRVSYYHGTSNKRASSIRMYSAFMVLPVYVTTERRRAEHYAMARAAYDGDDHYAIIRLDLAPHRVVVDDYSEGEPNQYKLMRPLHRNTFFSKHFWVDTFPMPVDEHELNILKAFCIGMNDGEERRVAPEFQYLLPSS